MTEQELPSIDIVLDEVRRRLDFQFEQLDGLGTKSSIVLGIAGVIFTLLVTNLLGQSNSATNLTLAKIALVPIFISIVLSFVPIYIRKFKRPPNLERLRFHYIVKDTKETKLKIIDICRKAVKDNEKLLKTIVGLIKCSYVHLVVGFVILAIWIGNVV